MRNKDVRTKAKKLGVYLYEVAEQMNISEATMTRLMRKQLNDNQKNKLYSIMSNIAKTKQEAR